MKSKVIIICFLLIIVFADSSHAQDQASYEYLNPDDSQYVTIHEWWPDPHYLDEYVYLNVNPDERCPAAVCHFYDDILIAVSHYTYDEAGNRTSMKIILTNSDGLCPTATFQTSYIYDADGRPIHSETTVSQDPGFQELYFEIFENICVDIGDRPGIPVYYFSSEEYEYNSDGQLIRQQQTLDLVCKALSQQQFSSNTVLTGIDIYYDGNGNIVSSEIETREADPIPD